MTHEVVPFDFIQQIYKGVERDALLAMFKQIAPQICAEDCPPYLAIGKKYTQEASFKSAWVTIHLYPYLCGTLEEATAYLRSYEGGCVIETKTLQHKIYTCFGQTGTCTHCHRQDGGAIVCDKGHGYASIYGCADVEWRY